MKAQIGDYISFRGRPRLVVNVREVTDPDFSSWPKFEYHLSDGNILADCEVVNDTVLLESEVNF